MDRCTAFIWLFERVAQAISPSCSDMFDMRHKSGFKPHNSVILFSFHWNACLYNLLLDELRFSCFGQMFASRLQVGSTQRELALNPRFKCWLFLHDFPEAADSMPVSLRQTVQSKLEVAFKILLLCSIGICYRCRH